MGGLLLQYVALQSRELVLEKMYTDIELLSLMIYVHYGDPHFYVISLLFLFSYFNCNLWICVLYMRGKIMTPIQSVKTTSM